jgi:hypothetical protein
MIEYLNFNNIFLNTWGKDYLVSVPGIISDNAAGHLQLSKANNVGCYPFSTTLLMIIIKINISFQAWSLSQQVGFCYLRGLLDNSTLQIPIARYFNKIKNNFFAPFLCLFASGSDFSMTIYDFSKYNGQILNFEETITLTLFCKSSYIYLYTYCRSIEQSI